jgi:hypothetical protein
MTHRLPIRLAVAAVLLIFVGILIIRQNATPPPDAFDPTNGQPAPMEAARVVERPGIVRPDKLRDPDGIENYYQVAPNLWIGSQPEGSNGYQSMTQMGIQTIVSVDGARPPSDVYAGQRYIHLPIGYGGITREQQLALAAIISNPEMYGNVYLHCHHGKHRGPAAAAAALRCIDPLFTAERAEVFLKQAGTDPRYAGLYRDVRDAKVASKDERAKAFSYTNRTPVGGLVERMVAIDETWDRIKACQKAGWMTPPNHPDVTPAHEALQLIEHFQELARLTPLPGGEFARFLKDAEAAAIEMETKIRMNESPPAIQAAFQRNAHLCVECHAATRDVKAK